MGLARCDDHKPHHTDEDCGTYALPVGYPNTAASRDIIGRIKSARLRLTADERRQFVAGSRVCDTARGASFRDHLFFQTERGRQRHAATA